MGVFRTTTGWWTHQRVHETITLWQIEALRGEVSVGSWLCGCKEETFSREEQEPPGKLSDESTQERKEASNVETTKKVNLPDIDENMHVTFDLEQNDLVPAENEVPVNACVNLAGDGKAYFAEAKPLEYVMKVKLELKKKLFLTLMCCLPTGTQGQMMLSETLDDDGFGIPQVVWLMLLCLVIFAVGRFFGHRRERLLEMRLAEAEMRLMEADRSAGTFAILMPKLNEALEVSYAENRRLQAAYDEAADNFDRVA